MVAFGLGISSAIDAGNRRLRLGAADGSRGLHAEGKACTGRRVSLCSAEIPNVDRVRPACTGQGAAESWLPGFISPGAHRRAGRPLNSSRQLRESE